MSAPRLCLSDLLGGNASQAWALAAGVSGVGWCAVPGGGLTHVAAQAGAWVGGQASRTVSG